MDTSLEGAVEAVEVDPSGSASFLSGQFKKHDDLKAMLDSNKDSMKLDAMKRIIGMVARGRTDARDLFPAVVKNVVSKNIEIKKLVYVYLTRYAEEQQDLALLSISTFQRALKDPNQLIRASALRVLSSIRVAVIIPIVMLAIKESAVDMSPFVRKTAAHAIPKLYSLDPEQKEELVGVIEKLLGDRTTLVVGSAVMAFEEVCPDRIELIHKNFRKFCNLLVDVEEWGQVIIINMLSRYARTQFIDPNACDELEEMVKEKAFYDDENSDESDAEEKVKKNLRPKMDPDHRLLLRSAKPLLQSRNAAVVMATAQLYHHCAPKAEVQVVAKAMIRLLRSHKEVQCIVLNCIASMTGGTGRQRNSMFEPFLRNFFIRCSDPTHIKILKLEIMTNIATETNIGFILREFQSYITGQDKVCVAATIQAIGRCAASISEVTDTCLNGLVHLLSNQDQAVVAESVVVIKKLLQTQSISVDNEHIVIITRMAKLVDSIQEPAAKAAILWVLGEYSQRVPSIAPDVLRKAAKNFPNEDVAVKLQILNLAAKLCLTNPEQCKLLAQYVFNLAKYDQNYDLRDRARFMRGMLFSAGGQEDNVLISNAKDVFLTTKPPPATESKFKDRDIYQLGSLSHFLNARAHGYQDLPDFPDTAPDAELRNVEPINPLDKYLNKGGVSGSDFADKISEGGHRASSAASKSKENGKFYSESGTSDSESSSGSDSESGSESSSSSSDEEPAKRVPKKIVNGSAAKLTTNKTESSSSGSSGSSSSEEDEEEQVVTKKRSATKASASKPASNVDLLLDLATEAPPSIPTPMLTPSLGGFLTPTSPANDSANAGPLAMVNVSAVHMPTKTTEILNKMRTGGLQVLLRYTRSPHVHSSSMCNLELSLTNQGTEELSDIKIGAKQLAPGMTMHEFPGIANLQQGETKITCLGINFNDTTQPAIFDIIANGRCHKVTVSPAIGELVRAIQMPENLFNSEQSKLRGMNETSLKATVPSSKCDVATIRKRMYELTNVLAVPSSDDGILKFSGRTLAGEHVVLLSIRLNSTDSTQADIIVNCEKMVIAGMLAKEVKLKLEED